MNIYQILIPQLIMAAVVVAIFLRAVRRSRLEAEAAIKESEARWAQIRAEARAEREAAAQAVTAANLLLRLDLSDEDALPDLRVATEQAQPLVGALSRQEQSLGGAGLTLTAAQVERGAVRLTLTPIDRAGSADRVKRLAELINAEGKPGPAFGALPPGVTAAHAVALAA